MEAVLRVKKDVPDLKAAVVVTDLPNEMGLASGRTGIMKQIEYARGRRSLDLCRLMDGFILLTEPMAEAIGIKNKPHIIIEGLIQTKTDLSLEQSPANPQTNAVLYTGTLESALGIGELLNAFQQMPEYELWICGQGHMQEEVKKVSRSHPNIRYFGFVPQKEALALQARATALINPRTPEGVFTRFSFPSKTLEYLRSGKPVLCYRLEGIPSDYDPYLFYIDELGESGIRFAVRKLMDLPEERRNEIALNGRDYVLNHKNPSVQCSKLLKLLRSL